MVEVNETKKVGLVVELPNGTNTTFGFEMLVNYFWVGFGFWFINLGFIGLLICDLLIMGFIYNNNK